VQSNNERGSGSRCNGGDLTAKTGYAGIGLTKPKTAAF
jgi:hypothetical protein